MYSTLSSAIVRCWMLNGRTRVHSWSDGIGIALPEHINNSKFKCWMIFCFWGEEKNICCWKLFEKYFQFLSINGITSKPVLCQLLAYCFFICQPIQIIHLQMCRRNVNVIFRLFEKIYCFENIRHVNNWTSEQ